LLFCESPEAVEWVRENVPFLVEQLRTAEKNASNEIAQILLLFLPEVLAQSDAFEEVVRRFPEEINPKTTPIVLNCLCSLPFAELTPMVCHCVCLALGRLLAATVSDRRRYRVLDEAFVGLFQELVRSLGVGLDAFPTDDAGRRRISAVWPQ
jgi:hypothetical protein